MKKILLVVILMLSLTACTSGEAAANGWQRYLDSSENSLVNLTLIDADEHKVAYFENTVASRMKENYKIQLNITNMPHEKVIEQLKNNKIDEITVGTIDLIWLDESLYKSLSTEGLLYKNFIDELQDINHYLLPNGLDNNYIGRTKTEHDIIPFNARQLTYYYNNDMIYDPPGDINLLNQLLDEKKGMFTYPHPKDPVGNAFVRNIILNFVEPDVFLNDALTESDVYAQIKPGLDYLKEIRPKLYAEGKSYPESSLELSDLFANEKVLVTMSYDYREGQQKSGDAIFPYGTKPFIFGEKNVAELDYIGIAYNAANKSGAMVVLNDLLSTEIQNEKIKNDDYWGLPPYDFDALSTSNVEALSKSFKKRSVINVDLLVKTKVHDIPKAYHEVITKLWEREILD